MCALTAGQYDKACLHCMTRKIKMLRTPDAATSRKLQLGTFDWMGARMAERVKEALRNEA